jgi:hypothetical protein
MKLIFTVALALAISAGSVTSFAQSAPAPTKSASKSRAPTVTKYQMHDGCHSRAAQMSGKPCH